MGPGLSSILGKAGVCPLFFDMGALRDADQIVVLVLLTHPTGHMAVLRDCVAQAVAHHGVFIAAGLVRIALQIVVDGLKALWAVVVIGVNHRERAVNQVACRQNGVGSAPGLYPAFRNRVALWYVIQLLIGVFHIDDPGQPVADGCFKGVLDFVLDHKNNGLKACPPGIIDGVVDDELAMASNRIHLLRRIGCPYRRP